MRLPWKTLIIIAMAMSLAACAAGSAASVHAASGNGLSQFLLGLWHGLIAPADLVLEVVNQFAPGVLPWKVRLFEVAAHSILYDLGFYIGIAASPVVIVSRRR